MEADATHLNIQKSPIQSIKEKQLGEGKVELLRRNTITKLYRKPLMKRYTIVLR
jgi:hypothetical protein